MNGRQESRRRIHSCVDRCPGRDDGESRFLAICEAQGGFTEPASAPHACPVAAVRAGHVQAVDNRRLARIAKLAGAPGSATAGIDGRLRIGDPIREGEPLFHVHARTPGELAYALEYAAGHPDIFSIERSR